MLRQARRQLAAVGQTLRERLRSDGAVWPVPVLTAADASEARAALLRELSGLQGRDGDFAQNDLMYYKSHLVFSAVDTLARHPTIVRAAQEALGSEDLLLWDASIPIKPPTGEASAFFPWHQDGTYWGLEPTDGAVSCWVALSEASREHGCMRVVRGSHGRPLQHTLRPQADSMLRRGQRVEGVDEAAAEAMALSAGEMSLHHPLALHCSGPNTTSEPRVGVVLVFAAPSTAPHNGVGSATLIAGRCDAPHWALSSWRPRTDAGVAAIDDAESLAAHASALAQHRGEMQARRE